MHALPRPYHFRLARLPSTMGQENKAANLRHLWAIGDSLRLFGRIRGRRETFTENDLTCQISATGQYFWSNPILLPVGIQDEKTYLVPDTNGQEVPIRLPRQRSSDRMLRRSRCHVHQLESTRNPGHTQNKKAGRQSTECHESHHG